MITPKTSGEKAEPQHPADRAATGNYERERPQSGSLKGFVLFAVLLTAVFVKSLIALAIFAASHELHSHILLIPFVSAYLIYIRRESLSKRYSFSPGWAVIPGVVGLISLAAAWNWHLIGKPLSENDYLSLMALSFVCLLAGGGFLFLGRKSMASVAFPFAFLIFMVPMPETVADSLETASKLASAEAANLFFNLSGTPTLRTGNVFDLPGISLEVAQECSGIRSSWVLFITSLLAANLFLKSPWRRLVLVAAVIPLGIIRNGLRILFIGLLCVHIGPEMINSIFHRRGGPPFFALSLIPLFLLLYWLRRGESGSSRASDNVRVEEEAGNPNN